MSDQDDPFVSGHAGDPSPDAGPDHGWDHEPVDATFDTDHLAGLEDRSYLPDHHDDPSVPTDDDAAEHAEHVHDGEWEQTLDEHWPLDDAAADDAFAEQLSALFADSAAVPGDAFDDAVLDRLAEP